MDSSLYDPNLPNVFNPEKYSHLEDGFWTTTWGDSSIYILFEMKNGKIDGRVIRFAFPSDANKLDEVDRFSVFHFENGEANGEFVKWWSYKDSIVSEKGLYVNGKKEGKWLGYYAEFAGYTLHTEDQYVNDRLHGTQKNWHPNGKLGGTSEYKNGVLCGMETRYYSNGQKALERIFYCESGYVPDNFDYINSWSKRGKPMVVDGEGVHKMYHKNGKVWKTGPVVNGKRHGEWKRYYEDGTFMRIENYENGVKVRGK